MNVASQPTLSYAYRYACSGFLAPWRADAAQEAAHHGPRIGRRPARVHKVRCYFTTATLLLYYSRWTEGQRMCMDVVTLIYMTRLHTYFKNIDIDIDIVINISICPNHQLQSPIKHHAGRWRLCWRLRSYPWPEAPASSMPCPLVPSLRSKSLTSLLGVSLP